MIRAATLADVPRLVAMGEDFHSYMNCPEMGPYSPVFASRTAETLINGDDGIFLAAEDEDGRVGGMVAGMVFPVYMTGWLISQEFMWWVDDTHKGYGKRLLKAFEEEAKARGARAMVMLALHSRDSDRIAKVYERAGYRPSEHTFIKEL